MRWVKKWVFTPDAKRLPHRPPKFSIEDIEFNRRILKMLNKIYKIQERPPKFADGYEYSEKEKYVEVESESSLIERECMIKLMDFRMELEKFLETTVKLKRRCVRKIPGDIFARSLMVRSVKNKNPEGGEI